MARPCQYRPVPIVESNEHTLETPSLKAIFRDITTLADGILQHNENASQVLRGLSSQYYRDQLGRLEQLKDQTESIKAAILDLGRSNFVGLRRLFKEPECIALSQIQLHLSKMDSIWHQTWDISRANETHRLAMVQREGFEEICNNISGQITRTRDDLDPIGNSSLTSILCPSALKWLNGAGGGTIESALPSNKNERDILKKAGGRYHKWQCPDCPRKVKFYVKTREPTLESAIFPARIHSKVHTIKVKWRDMWCAKSHLAHGAGVKYACLLCLGQGKDVEVNQTAFDDDTDLARHIGLKHNSHTLPAIFMQRLHITRKSDDEAANRSSRDSNEMGRERSDLRFLLE